MQLVTSTSTLQRPVASRRAGAPHPVLATRRGHTRRPLPVPTAVDPALAATAVSEVWSAIGAVSVAGATLFGLASIIRQANYDPAEIALRERVRDSQSRAAAAALPAMAAAAAVEEEAEVVLSVEERRQPAAPVPAPAPQAPARQPPVAARQPVSAAAATTRVTEPFVAAKHKPAAAAAKEPQREPSALPTTAESNPALAAAVLEQLAADAPVAATPVGSVTSADSQGPALADAQPAAPAAVAAAGKLTLDAPAAAAVAGKMTTDAAAAAAMAAEAAPAKAATAVVEPAEAAAAYEERLNRILSDSQLAYQKTRSAQQAARAAPARESEGTRLRQRVAQLSASYQDKIDSLWQGYEKKRAEEAAVLKRGEKILLDLVAVEEANKAKIQSSNPLVALWQRVVAFFAAIFAWVQQLVQRLLGSGTSGAGSGAGASA